MENLSEGFREDESNKKLEGMREMYDSTTIEKEWSNGDEWEKVIEEERKENEEEKEEEEEEGEKEEKEVKR